MDLGSVLSVAQTLSDSLQCSQLKDVSSFLGYKPELENLANTVEIIRAVLCDAESKGDELSHQAQRYILDLKDVIYEADDLLDMFVTLAERKHKKLSKNGATSRALYKVRGLFSRIKGLPSAYYISNEVKSIRKKLNGVADNHNKFGFKLDLQPIRMRREETCSYVYAKDIIGRDADKEKIAAMLMDPNLQRGISFLTIVGIGGLGKTTLAQLIYNDVRIVKRFPTRCWACLGDEDTKHLNVKAVLAKIVNHTQDEYPTLESLQSQLQGMLSMEKFLLILDDVWNENRSDWLRLESFLKGGRSGSWVVVTTRSSNTASIIGDGSTYDLKGLSDADSWSLFKRVAFGQKERQETPPDLVEIGQTVVRKCANVPLAIIVVGSLLYGQEKYKWILFAQNRSMTINPKKDGIFPILKFSYHHLESPLKSCFIYCSLFPKDYRIEKEMLIRLWLAQGYIVPFDEGQSSEDAAEEYFSILLRRCFFQDVEDYGEGDISFKLHDLMHDVAQQVARNEVRIVDCITNDMDRRILHVNVGNADVKGHFSDQKVRTLLYDFENKHKNDFTLGIKLENWVRLRAMGLSYFGLRSLPNKIDKLLHLRYLDLFGNTNLEKLPKTFVKLHNLETLMLDGCWSLRELPHDFGKLVKLRFLDIMGCNELKNMPASIGKLSCLQRLKMFVMNSCCSTCCIDGLEALKALTQLCGRMWIKIIVSKDATYVLGSWYHNTTNNSKTSKKNNHNKG